MKLEAQVELSLKHSEGGLRIADHKKSPIFIQIGLFYKSYILEIII